MPLLPLMAAKPVAVMGKRLVWRLVVSWLPSVPPAYWLVVHLERRGAAACVVWLARLPRRAELPVTAPGEMPVLCLLVRRLRASESAFLLMMAVGRGGWVAWLTLMALLPLMASVPVAVIKTGLVWRLVVWRLPTVPPVCRLVVPAVWRGVGAWVVAQRVVPHKAFGAGRGHGGGADLAAGGVAAAVGYPGGSAGSACYVAGRGCLGVVFDGGGGVADGAVDAKVASRLGEFRAPPEARRDGRRSEVGRGRGGGSRGDDINDAGGAGLGHG